MNQEKEATKTTSFLSFEGRLLLVFALCTLINVALFSALFLWFSEILIAAVLSLIVGLGVGIFLLRRLIGPVNKIFQALLDGMQNFKDGDFGVSIATHRRDELGALTSAYNDVKEVLRRDRLELYQKELLLDTVNQTTPISMLLVNTNKHITYSNMSARKLLLGGRKLEGLNFEDLVAQHLPSFAEALELKTDGLYSIESKGEVETYHISWRSFKLHGKKHDLYLIREMTREFNRQEVATWKKVIRVISHELNNSLAPISSLAHSGQIMLNGKDETQIANLDRIFATIEERARYLKQFIDGYARFAKLPKPKIETVELQSFFSTISDTTGLLKIHLPDRPDIRIDPAQIQQVLINLIKNALESGCEIDAIDIEVKRIAGHLLININDKGNGMSEEELQNSLLPFYSTKTGGSGLGLPLCREIIEAHGGRIQLKNRPEGGLSVCLTLPQ